MLIEISQQSLGLMEYSMSMQYTRMYGLFLLGGRAVTVISVCAATTHAQRCTLYVVLHFKA
jgi:hypothetical protein